MLAQSTQPSCPAGLPVDDIIAEVHKQQSKKKHRNPDPLPNVVCIGGWCRDRSRTRTPPTIRQPTPQSTPSSSNDSNTSSSKLPADKCQEALEMAIEAAHNVEVGDYYFADKNYNGAMLRYKDASEEKPGDVAIHVRLGRVLEKLGQLPQAIEQYTTAQGLAGPEKWMNEAKAALLRLQPHPRS
jgi:tetratricopeptide (TPR) repeat protein